MDGASIEDLFGSLGPTRTKRMFSGYGVFADDLCFALALGGELYLKVDALTEPAFREAGSAPFSYLRKGREVAVAFWRLPDAALDDPDVAARWGRLALEAARRARAAKLKRTPSSKGAPKSRVASEPKVTAKPGSQPGAAAESASGAGSQRALRKSPLRRKQN